MDMDTLWKFVLVVLGGVLTIAGGVAQQLLTARTRREEREWETAQRVAEQDAKRRSEEADALWELYRRAALVGMEYRQIEEGVQDHAERWAQFLPRFQQVTAELRLRGSQIIADAFVAYVDHVQALVAEDEYLGYERHRDGWEHRDLAVEKLMVLMRADVEQRRRRAP
jgi:hypothetical protein